MEPLLQGAGGQGLGGSRSRGGVWGSFSAVTAMLRDSSPFLRQCQHVLSTALRAGHACPLLAQVTGCRGQWLGTQQGLNSGHSGPPPWQTSPGDAQLLCSVPCVRDGRGWTQRSTAIPKSAGSGGKVTSTPVINQIAGTPHPSHWRDASVGLRGPHAENHAGCYVCLVGQPPSAFG